MARVITIQPAVVMLDGTDPMVTQHCPLSDLLFAIPSLRAFCLDLKHDQVQVVTSQQHRAAKVGDLAAVIERFY